MRTMMMIQQEPGFQPYRNSLIADDDDMLATNSNSNRNSYYSSVSNEIGDDDESVPMVEEEKLYVALGNDLKEGKRILSWALKNSGGKTICIVHVHQPALMIPFMGGKIPANKLAQRVVREYSEVKMKRMQNVLNEYLCICKRAGVQAEKLHIEKDSIEKGIVETISHYGMKRLVMGAAAAKYFSRKMTTLKSKKAMYVNAEAPVTCHISFVWKGDLICTREGIWVSNEEVTPKMQQLSLNPEAKTSDPVIAHLVARQQSIFNLSPSEVHWRPVAEKYLDGGTSGSTSRISEVSSDQWDGIFQSSRPSRGSPRDGVSRLALTFYANAEGGQRGQDENGMQLLALPPPQHDITQASPLTTLEERVDFKLYDQREQAMAETRSSSRDASEERARREIAEQQAVDAVLRARASESKYADELNQREKVEAKLLEEILEHEKVRNQLDEARHELQYARDQQAQLEARLAKSDAMVGDLEERIFSALGLIKNYKKQRDDLQTERDNALRVGEDLRRQKAKSSTTNFSQLFSEFSFFEIEEATRSFHPSLKIGEGSYGTTYKGLLRHTEVTIKMMHSNSVQPSEYHQEVDILSKVRHPNLVTLIGACPEASTLIYEYLPNGSLEDRLNCKDNTPPLSWQTRVRIAAEICSALVFLHSYKPHSIVHGDLKPTNILLDDNLITKLSAFGIWRVVLPDANASVEVRNCYRADPQGLFPYTDPELFTSGGLTTEGLTTKSDVYSFGIILLRLLTGKSALGIVKEARSASDNGNLKYLLDDSAGDWPYVQVHQLANLALRCVDMKRKNRPDLGLEVWRVLRGMHASCGGSSSSSLRLGSEGTTQAPHYFVCPIFQEVMQDPHVAADGFTYEAESLRGWLDSGHDTSPMTNLKLANTNLIPNLALRSAIQEWMQKQKP